MKRTVIFYLLLFLYSSLSAQKTLTLDECQELAKANYPMARQLDLVDQTKAIKLSNLLQVWLPKLSVSTSAVTTAGFPTIKPVTDGLKEHDFLATISVNLVQPIWDGGISIAQKKIVEANAEVQKADIEVSLHKLKEHVAECYFGVILLQEQLKISNKNLELIKRYAEQGRVLRHNGAMSSSDLKNIEIEVLQQEQQVVSNSSALISSIKVLSLLIGKQLSENANLVTPIISPVGDDVLLHPKSQLFYTQEKHIATQKRLIKMQCVPKLSLNASYLGVAPALPIMNNNINHLWYAGITLSWNISSLYSLKNNLTDIKIRQQNISTLKSSFDQEIKISVEKEKGEIFRLTHLLEKDREIMKHSEELASIAESKFRNGTINATDFLKAINTQFQAKQVMVIHEIELLHHQYTKKIILRQ